MSKGENYTEIEVHTLYVAHCAECNEQADDDGGEYRNTPEDAVSFVEANHGWQRGDDGRLLCEVCREGNGPGMGDLSHRAPRRAPGGEFR
jgi:hypothetical protein